MKTPRFIIVLFAFVMVLAACKDDVKEDVQDEVAEKAVETPETTDKKEAVGQNESRQLSKEQRDNSNSVMNKIMRTREVSQFGRALVSAGIMADLSKLEDEYTVLAPSNETFNSLPEGKNVVTDPSQREALVNLLQTHLIKGKISSAEMLQKIQKNGSYTLQTMSGEKVEATLAGNMILITNKKLDKTAVLGKSDIQGTNGVLHVVKGFLK